MHPLTGSSGSTTRGGPDAGAASSGSTTRGGPDAGAASSSTGGAGLPYRRVGSPSYRQPAVKTAVAQPSPPYYHQDAPSVYVPTAYGVYDTATVVRSSSAEMQQFPSTADLYDPNNAHTSSGAAGVGSYGPNKPVKDGRLLTGQTTGTTFYTTQERPTTRSSGSSGSFDNDSMTPQLSVEIPIGSAAATTYTDSRHPGFATTGGLIQRSPTIHEAATDEEGGGSSGSAARGYVYRNTGSAYPSSLSSQSRFGSHFRGNGYKRLSPGGKGRGRVERWATEMPAECISLCALGCAVTAVFIYWLDREAATRIAFIATLFAFAGALFAWWLLKWILRFDEGPAELTNVARPILEGSEGFFLVQYGSIARITTLFAGLVFFLYLFRSPSNSTEELSHNLPRIHLALCTSVTLILGAFCSGLSGYSGMWVSVRTNVRVAAAANRCYNDALRLCFRGGAFSSVVNVALAVGGVSVGMLLLSWIFPSVPLEQRPLLLVGFGFGASLVALFAQLGGGIYTKAADIGADLVGKVEAGIPEDDPRNPAVVADLVGDNVGDCAGQCADLFESIAAEIVAAMILGGALSSAAGLSKNESVGFVLFPLVVHCMDLVISSFGIMAVATTKGMPDASSSAGGKYDPLRVMIRVYLWTCCGAATGFTLLCRTFLYTEAYPKAWAWMAACGLVGMACAFFTLLITQYYTDYDYAPVRRIAEASTTGPATNIISGLAVGLESTALPVLLLATCVLIAYYCGCNSGLSPEEPALAGLFGTAVATMGMLCTAVYVLTMSSFGPIADNAGGIVEMSQQGAHVRAVTDRLDAIGNVTKANTKGFSVGTASLACFLLFAAFLDEIKIYTGKPVGPINLAKPEVFIGGLLGSTLVYLFCAFAMEAVGRTAQQVVTHVRKQFKDNPGIIEGTDTPDYHTCVAMVSRSALQQMVRPGLLAVLTPIAVGAAFKMIGYMRGDSDLGAEALAGFLMFSTASGILTALFLNNAGGAWDNAKKFVETGALGGKGSSTHKAAVVGDTVGDPCKDTAGPSVHVLIKLVSTVTMVLAPIFVCNV